MAVPWVQCIELDRFIRGSVPTPHPCLPLSGFLREYQGPIFGPCKNQSGNGHWVLNQKSVAFRVSSIQGGESAVGSGSFSTDASKTTGIDDPNTLLPLRLQFQDVSSPKQGICRNQTRSCWDAKEGTCKTVGSKRWDEKQCPQKELNLHESLTDQGMQSSCIQQFTQPQASFACENCSIRSRSPATAALACNGVGHTDVLSMAELSASSLNDIPKWWYLLSKDGSQSLWCHSIQGRV